jgi:hypothetical protein
MTQIKTSDKTLTLGVKEVSDGKAQTYVNCSKGWTEHLNEFTVMSLSAQIISFTLFSVALLSVIKFFYFVHKILCTVVMIMCA